MVKPEKARRVEEMLIHAAKSGALRGKVTEDQFIQMLEQVNSRAGNVASFSPRKHRKLVLSRISVQYGFLSGIP